MKICLIMGGNEEGGLENHVIEIGNALAENHEIHIIAHKKYRDRFKGVNYHSVDLTQSRRNPALLYQVAVLIHKISPSIIHAQANKAVSIIATLKWFIPKNVKLVASLHSLKRSLGSYEKFDWVIGVSHSVLEKLKNPNQSVIYNGVRFDRGRLKQRSYLQDEFGIPSNNKVVVTIGRLVEVKRFDILIEAFQGIENTHLLIFGEGQKRYDLEQQAQKFKHNKIHMPGFRKDNIELLSAADVCVISSEREGFSYVMAESLLVGTPVISTDVADMKKILPQQAVVGVNNIEQLHYVLVNVCTDYETFLESFQPAFQWAVDNLSFEIMLKDTEQVYQDLIK